MLNWLERNALRALLLLVVAVMMASSMYWEGVARAAATAAPEPAEECVPWRTAGQWTMYACAEDWELGVTCIHSDSGFMSCKWEE